MGTSDDTSSADRTVTCARPTPTGGRSARRCVGASVLTRSPHQHYCQRYIVDISLTHRSSWRSTPAPPPGPPAVIATQRPHRARHRAPPPSSRL